MSDTEMTQVEMLANVLAGDAREAEISAEKVRGSFALALEILEREGLIPGVAPELREVSEGGALADLRAFVDAEAAKCDHGYFRGATPEWIQGRQEALEEVRGRLAAAGVADARPEGGDR